MPTNLTEMFESLKTEPKADAMDFFVERPPEKRKPGETISVEAMEDLSTAIQTFILARLYHHWDGHEGGLASQGPAVIRAEVRLHIDDVHGMPDEDRRPWYALRNFGVRS